MLHAPPATLQSRKITQGNVWCPGVDTHHFSHGSMRQKNRSTCVGRTKVMGRDLVGGVTRFLFWTVVSVDKLPCFICYKMH